MVAEWTKCWEACLSCFVKEVGEVNSGIKHGKDFSAEALLGFGNLARSMQTAREQPQEFLKNLVEEEKMQSLKAKADEIGNLGQIIALTYKTLLDGNALEVVSSDDNLAALISVVQKPGDFLKKLPSFDVFCETAETRLLAMLRKSLVSITAPVLKSSGSKQLLAFISGKSTDLQLDSIVEAKNQAELARKECEAFAKAFPDWLHKEVLDLGAEMSEGGDGDQQDSQVSQEVKVALWVACSFPSTLKVMACCKECHTLERDLQGSDAGVEKYQDFVKAIISANAEMEEFQNFTASLTLSGESDGKRVLICQKLVTFFEGAIGNAAKGVAKSVTKMYEDTKNELGQNLQDTGLAGAEELINEGCSDGNMQKLLTIAQSKTSKALHSNVKQLDFMAEVFAVLSGLKNAKCEGCEPACTLVESGLQGVGDDQVQQGKTLNVCLATVQALWRPMKAGEERGQLARRARVMITSRGVKVPPNLDLLVTKMAAATTADKGGNK